MLYLQLTHGRTRPEEDLLDWGRDGPCLGPFRWVHLTYLVDLRAEDEAGQECQFEMIDDLIYYDGLHFGDVTIESECDRATPEKFDATKAQRARATGDEPAA